MFMLDLTTARALFHYDPESGVVTRKVAVHYSAPCGAVVGSPNSQGYLQVTHRQRKYKVHRLIWLLQTGSWPDKSTEIDHRDNDKVNNRWSNLRLVTPAQNMQNARKARANSLTGVLGVTHIKRTGRFAARIYHDGRLKHLGVFLTAEEAHAAYLEAKRKYHEGNTL